MKMHSQTRLPRASGDIPPRAKGWKLENRTDGPKSVAEMSYYSKFHRTSCSVEALGGGGSGVALGGVISSNMIKLELPSTGVSQD